MGATRWRKILYEKQPFADNYVSRDDFLSGLRKNVTVRLHSYQWLVLHSLPITRQLATLLVFVSFFHGLHTERITAHQLILLANVTTLIFYAAWVGYVWQSGEGTDKQAGKQAGKSGILFMLALLGLTPILKTLTEDTASDSIWMLSSIALGINFAFFDYRMPPEGKLRGDDSMALNAAIFASVLLASRLPSNAHVFGLMSLAVVWFALLPPLLRAMQQRRPTLHLLVSLGIIGGAFGMLMGVDVRGAVLYALLAIFISFISPAVFVYMQRYKNQIHGPWDEATIQ